MADRFFHSVLLLLLLSLRGGHGQALTVTERLSWEESLQRCREEGGDLTVFHQDNASPPAPGTFWVGAHVTLSTWTWMPGGPLYDLVQCQENLTEAEKGMELKDRNQAGTCFHHCQNYAYVGLKGSRCYCVGEKGRASGEELCVQSCFSNPSETCGGHDAYSLYRLNLKARDRMHMKWTTGNETAATFIVDTDSRWLIQPALSSRTFNIYCYRSLENFMTVQGRNETTANLSELCKGFTPVTFALDSEVTLKLQHAITRRTQGWVSLRRSLQRHWIDGREATVFDRLNDSVRGPLCGAVTSDGLRVTYVWRLCDTRLPALCKTAALTGANSILYIGAGSAGAVVLAAILLTFLICRRRRRFKSGASRLHAEPARRAGDANQAVPRERSPAPQAEQSDSYDVLWGTKPRPTQTQHVYGEHSASAPLKCGNEQADAVASPGGNYADAVVAPGSEIPASEQGNYYESVDMPASNSVQVRQLPHNASPSVASGQTCILGAGATLETTESDYYNIGSSAVRQGVHSDVLASTSASNPASTSGSNPASTSGSNPASTSGSNPASTSGYSPVSAAVETQNDVDPSLYAQVQKGIYQNASTKQEVAQAEIARSSNDQVEPEQSDLYACVKK